MSITVLGAEPSLLPESLDILVIAEWLRAVLAELIYARYATIPSDCATVAWEGIYHETR